MSELDETILARSIGRELDGTLPKRQTSMDEFSNIEIERSEKWCREREAGDSENMDETILDFLERDRAPPRGTFGEFVLPGPVSS